MKQLFLSALCISLFMVSCQKDEVDVVIEANNLPLTGTQSVPSVTTNAVGSMNLKFNKTTGVLSYTVTWNGLTGPHHGMHFHRGNRGTNGSIVKNIQASGSATGSITESWTVPDSLHQRLEQGGLYINIHSDAHPDGEIRGQIEF